MNISLNDTQSLLAFGQIIEAFKNDGFESAVKDLNTQMQKVADYGNEISTREDAIKKQEAAIGDMVTAAADALAAAKNRLDNADSMMANASSLRKTLDDSLGQLNLDKKTFYNEYESKTEALTAREAALAEKEAAAEQAKNEAQALIDEYTSKLALIRQITE